MCNLILIASSTGGPQTLRGLLGGLRELNCALVLIQHIQASACRLFVKSLDRLSEMPAVMAADAMPIESGVIYLAPTGRHARLTGGRFELVDGEPVNHCKPSADVAMSSVRAADFDRIAGIVLTGLGRDGAAGLAALRRQGALCIAQSPGTCIVPNMPEAAIAAGAVDRIMDLGEIRAALQATQRRGVRQATTGQPPGISTCQIESA